MHFYGLAETQVFIPFTIYNLILSPSDEPTWRNPIKKLYGQIFRKEKCRTKQLENYFKIKIKVKQRK